MERLSRDKVLDMIRTTVREKEPDAQIIPYGSRGDIRHDEMFMRL